VIFKAILDGTPTPTNRLNPDTPPKLEGIIKKALEKDKKLRCQNASEMRSDLARLKRDAENGKASASLETRKRTYSRRRLRVAVAGAAAVVHFGAAFRLPNLQVMARSTVSHYKSRQDDPQGVGATYMSMRC
jgi:hypothetical protein